MIWDNFFVAFKGKTVDPAGLCHHMSPDVVNL